MEFELYPGEYPLYAYHGDKQVAELKLIVGEESLDVELQVDIASYTGIPGTIHLSVSEATTPPTSVPPIVYRDGCMT